MVTTIGAGKELSGVGPKVDTAGIRGVGAERMAKDAQNYMRSKRHPTGQRLPLFPSILGPIHTKVFSNIAPGLAILDYRVNRVGMTGIQRYRKPKLGGQIMLDIHPIFTSISAFIYAAVILLIEKIGVGGMLNNPVYTLAILGIDVG
jgi:hypothetical protein